jgi:stringent starvation protein B
MTQLLPPKKEVALALLERSNVDVYLDPRAKGVVVPPQFRKEPRLILKIGLNMPVPIPDLRLDEDSMSCTLSFNRSPFYCVVPWSSVFAMVGEDGRGMVWPDDVPQELAVKVVDPDRGPRDVSASPSPNGSSAGIASPTSASSGTPSSSNGRRNGRAPARERAGAPSDDVAGVTSAARGAPAASSKSGSGGKRKKKKEESTRPVLVSVPPPAASARPPSPAAEEGERDSQREAAGSDRPREIRQPPEQRRPGAPREGASPRDGVSPIPSSRPTPSLRQPPPSQRRPPGAPAAPGDQARPKRELPPYLRVVK